MEKEKDRSFCLGRVVKLLILVAVIVGIIAGIAVFAVNGIIVNNGKKKILAPEETAKLDDVDCILVLGCQVKDDGTPSRMLRDRVLQGVALYELGVSDTILMSGDSHKEDYDEVGTMKALAEECGVPAEAIVTDPYGLSTYDSVLRAMKLYGYDKIVIVTQEYHLYRALYIAEENDIDAYGVSSDLDTYDGQFLRDVREIAARCKDYFFCLVGAKPEMGWKLPD